VRHQLEPFAGNSFDCFTPFTLVVGIALLFGYGLLGAGWLIIKTDGWLQAWARLQARRCLIGVLAGILLVSVWTPLQHPAIAGRWFEMPNLLLLAPIPEFAPFVGALLLFLLCYAGVGVSLFPLIAPPTITLFEAASSPSTQAFLLVGTLALPPVIDMYTAWSYWVFRGKVRTDVGYH